MTSQTTTLDPIEAEIGLLDIVNFFKENWKFIAQTALSAGIIGTAYAWIAPPKYVATASFQTAKVANAEVEPTSILLAKLKMPLYYSTNSYEACDLSDRRRPGFELAKALRPVMDKTVPIIEISYKSSSPEKATKCLEIVLTDIRTHQNEISKPLLKIKKSQLFALKEKLESTEQISKFLTAKKPNFDFNDSKFSASTLLLATTLSKEIEAKDLRAQVNDLETVLSEPQTKGTYLSTPIYASSVPVGPGSVVIVLVSLFMGATVATGYVLGKKVWIKLHST